MTWSKWGEPHPCIYLRSLYTNQPGASGAQSQPLHLPRRYVLICPGGTKEGILTSHHLARGDFTIPGGTRKGILTFLHLFGVALSRKRAQDKTIIQSHIFISSHNQYYHSHPAHNITHNQPIIIIKYSPLAHGIHRTSIITLSNSYCHH